MHLDIELDNSMRTGSSHGNREAVLHLSHSVNSPGLCRATEQGCAQRGSSWENELSRVEAHEHQTAWWPPASFQVKFQPEPSLCVLPPWAGPQGRSEQIFCRHRHVCCVTLYLERHFCSVCKGQDSIKMSRLRHFGYSPAGHSMFFKHRDTLLQQVKPCQL